MKLSDILDATAVSLEVDDLAFRLRPFTNAQVLEWNRVTFAPSDEGALVERVERQQTAQIDLIAKHMRSCVVEGRATQVTPKWVRETLPLDVVQDLAAYFVRNERPSWAVTEGN